MEGKSRFLFAEHKTILLRLLIVAVLILWLITDIAGQIQPVSANGNQAPVYNSGLVNQLFNRNYTFSYHFSCCFIDPDGDYLTYTAALTDGSPLPAWLYFDGPTRTFSGTTENTAGSFNIRVTAADTFGATAVGDFTFQVQGGAPQFNIPIPNQSVKEGVPFSYTVPAGTFTDPDGDTLSYTYQVKKTKPDWLNIDEPTMHFWGTPTTGVTSWKVIITASDGIDGAVSGEFLLSLVANLPPVYNGGIVDQVWTAGHTYYYQFADTCFTDYEGDPVTYTILLADGRTIEDVYPWIHFDGSTRTFSGITGNNLGEVITCLIQASDPTSSTSVRFHITVLSDYHVTASAGANGSISPPGTTYSLPGGSLSYTIMPDECHNIADVLVDGVSVGAVASYTFNNITANHTISASFTNVSITSVSPAQGNPGQALVIAITGANLWGATSVSFGADIIVTGFTVNSNTQVTANISISPGAAPGARSVSITTPEGTGTLANAFTVNQTTQQVNSATGTGIVTFTTSNGSITNLTALSTTPCGSLNGFNFPHGYFSINITAIPAGSTVTIIITFPSDMPTNTRYWKCIDGQWVDCTSLLGDNDGDNILTLTITDGGLGDGDDQANGIIVDPGGPATQVTVAAPRSAAPADGPHAAPALLRQLNPAQMSVQYLNVSPQLVSANQLVTITTNVVNAGDEAGSINVPLKINGKVEQTRVVSVGPQGTQPVKFTITKAQPGTYNVDILGQNGSFNIMEASGTTGKPVNGGLVVLVVMTVLILATSVVLMMSFRRPA